MDAVPDRRLRGSRRRLGFGVLLALLAASALAPRCQGPTPIQGLVYGPGGGLLLMSDAEFGLWRDSPDLTYVLFAQRPLDSLDATDRALLASRAQELSDEGKKLILQIWWGGQEVFISGPRGYYWPWEVYSLPNIARDGDVQARFLDHAVKPLIDLIGPQNLYGVHLLEESGLQHASDADDPGQCGPDDVPAECLGDHMLTCLDDDLGNDDPVCSGLCADFVDGSLNDDGNAYDTPYFAARNYAADAKYDGLRMCNVFRHRGDFKAITGLDLYDPPDCDCPSGVDGDCLKDCIDADIPRDVVEGWIAQRLVIDAERAFAGFVRAEYPGLKVFSWLSCDLNSNTAVGDCADLASVVDGFILQGGSNFAAAYREVRQARRLLPGAELLFQGHIDADLDWIDKVRLATLGFVGGAEAFGILADEHSWQDPEVAADPTKWGDDQAIHATLRRLDPIAPENRVLVVSAITQDLLSDVYQLAAFSHFDAVAPQDLHAIELSDYDLIVFYANAAASGPELSRIQWDRPGIQAQYGFGGWADEQRLETFVQGGGLVVLIGAWDLGPDRPLLTKDHLATGGNDSSGVRTLDPSGWACMPPGATYQTHIRYFNPVTHGPLWSDVTVLDPALEAAGIYVPRGAGAVLAMPMWRICVGTCDTDDIEGAYAQAWRRYLHDVFSALATCHAKPEVLEALVEGDAGQGYLRQSVLAKQGAARWDGVTTITFLDGPTLDLEGEDVFGGAVDPTFTEADGAMIVVDPTP